MKKKGGVLELELKNINNLKVKIIPSQAGPKTAKFPYLGGGGGVQIQNCLNNKLPYFIFWRGQWLLT